MLATRHHCGRARKQGRAESDVTDEARAEARRQAAEKAERDRRLNAERDAAEAQRAIAAQVRASHGPSGANAEYVLRLAEALRELGGHDPHVQELASLVRVG